MMSDGLPTHVEYELYTADTDIEEIARIEAHNFWDMERLDDPPAYRVAFSRQSYDFEAVFPDVEAGGRLAALHQALRYRDRIVRFFDRRRQMTVKIHTKSATGLARLNLSADHARVTVSMTAGKPKTRSFPVVRYGLRGAIRQAAEHLHFDRIQYDGDKWPFASPQGVAEVVYFNLGLGPLRWRDHIRPAGRYADHAHLGVPFIPDPEVFVLHPSGIALAQVIYLLDKDLPDEAIAAKLGITYDEIWASRLYLAEARAERHDAVLPSTSKRLMAFFDSLLPYPADRARCVLAEVARVQSGVSPSALKPLARRLGMTTADLCEHLSIRLEALSAVEEGGGFPLATSERILRVERVLDQAVTMLGTEETARAWMRTPLSVFEGRSPLDLSLTEVGAAEVAYLLSRLAYRVDVKGEGWGRTEAAAP